MNRRAFFRRTAGLIAGAALAPLLRKPTPTLQITPEMSRAMAGSMRGLFNRSPDVHAAFIRDHYLRPAAEHMGSDMGQQLAAAYGLKR